MIGIVKFIDFKIGDESGYIRFEEPEAAQKARAAAVLAEQGGLAVKSFMATLEPVSGTIQSFNVLLSKVMSIVTGNGFFLLLIMIARKISISNITWRSFF